MLSKSVVAIALAFISVIAAHPTQSDQAISSNDGEDRLLRRANGASSTDWRNDKGSFGSFLLGADIPNVVPFTNAVDNLLKSSSSQKHYPLTGHMGVALVPQGVSYESDIKILWEIPNDSHVTVYASSGRALCYSKRNGEMYINCAKMVAGYQIPGYAAYAIDRVLDPNNGDYDLAIKGLCGRK
ncbi:hypothetical protein BDF22DRAFT_662582 [Syncephalis plumigaleata]|nr:hypothetical protein BDF22DRAFT_662582 [Syncephalis plumigaleata]